MYTSKKLIIRALKKILWSTNLAGVTSSYFRLTKKILCKILLKMKKKSKTDFFCGDKEGQFETVIQTLIFF